jgi:glycosyltransferase involved in cell wall biosynthesis
MAQRLKVALIYSYNTNWVAGAYYILNLIHALKELDDKDKPQLIILSNTREEFNTIVQTGYPYLQFFHLQEKDFWASYSLPERMVNKLFRSIFKRNIFYREHTKKRFPLPVDVLFPATNHVYFAGVTNKLFWIPDFQEYFLPQFFSVDEITQRKNHQKRLVEEKAAIVFSSQNALSHFRQFYPSAKSPVFVLPFAVTHPNFRNISVESLKQKYNIHDPYFFCANQFWAHKNHMVILKAIKKIREKEKKDFVVAFSGKEFDHRNPEFFNTIKSYIAENSLENHVRLLGFMDRGDQLQLMNHSIAVIQPSLFEGWSTVVEDAKAMGKHVIVSNLDVHREQLPDNGTFFDPADENDLADKMLNAMKFPPAKINTDYKEAIRTFGDKFIQIVKALKPN